MATQSDTAFTVRAAYAEMEAARRAIAALERHGIPGSDIKLEGPGAEEAKRDLDQSDNDERFMHEAEKSVLVGGAIGAAAGVLLGLIGGIVWLGSLGIYLGAVAGLFGGGGLGFLVGAMSRVQESDASELTYADAESEVIVAVHTQDRDDFDKAVKELGETDPAPKRLERVDSEGNPIDG